MKKLFSLLLAVILILPMGACAEEGGENMAKYLYNDVEAPDINEVWDRKTYPYATMLIVDTNAIIDTNGADWAESVIFSTAPLYHEGKWGKPAVVAGDTAVCYESKTGVWQKLYTWNPSVDSTYAVFESQAFWTNYNHLDADGELVLAATPPILVDSKLSVSVKTAAEGKMLYGSKELPPLPEMTEEQKAQYPYVFLWYHTILGIYKAYALSDVSYVVDDGAWCIDLSAKHLRMKWYPGSDSNQPDADWSGWSENTDEATAIWDTTIYVGTVDWANFDVMNEDGTVRLHASEPSIYGARFVCTGLTSTEKVYQVKAWCYPAGMDYWTAPATWESVLFAGTYYSVFAPFTDLLPGTEYEVYAVIYANDVATEHNAATTFTTVASEEETVQAIVLCNDVTSSGFTARLFVEGLDSGTEYTAEFAVYRNDASGVIYKDVTFTGEEGFKVYSCAFDGLLPNTTYVVAVDLYPTDTGVIVAHCEREVTTLEGVPVVVDSFPLGFASGLCGLPITEDNADYNTWAQGHIVGAAMRKAL